MEQRNADALEEKRVILPDGLAALHKTNDFEKTSGHSSSQLIDEHPIVCCGK